LNFRNELGKVFKDTTFDDKKSEEIYLAIMKFYNILLYALKGSCINKKDVEFIKHEYSVIIDSLHKEDSINRVIKSINKKPLLYRQEIFQKMTIAKVFPSRVLEQIILT
jgi:hypothetical protein